MSVIGDAFVAIHPDSAGFASKLQTQLSAVNLGGAGALLGATAVAGVVVGLAKIGQAFGSAKVQIQRETGATGQELQQTFDSVKNVLKDVPDSIGSVTTAIDELRRRGTPLGSQLDKLAKQELDLARITKTELAGNVEQTTAIFAKFNVPLREQPAALDAIFKGYQQSGKGLTDLTSALLSGGASLTQFGFNLADSTALIAGLEKAGVNVQPALAGLKKAFGSIVKDGGDPKRVLADLIKEFSDGTPKATAMADAIKLFGARSGVELATAIQQGKFNVQDILKIITDGKGGIEATSLATRTFGEEMGILKNQVLVDLQPLGSQVWTTLRAAILSATDPVGALVSALSRLGQALSPLITAIGVLVAVGFGALLGIVSLVAKGLDTVASVLEHIPAPVLIAAGAIAILAKAFFALKALGALASVGDAIAGLSLGVGAILNPVTLVIGALALIGGAMVIFGSKTSAASKEAKELSKVLFDTADSGHVFASGITSAAQGLSTFLTKQDAAGKIKDLDKVLEGTGLTLTDVSRAVAGTGDDFDALKRSLQDKLGIPDVAVAFANMSIHQQSAAVSAQLVTGKTIEQANAYKSAVKAIDQQRDAFVQSAEAQIQLIAHTSPANQAIADQAEKIAHATTGTRGYGAALDFLNEALTENAAKQDKVKIASKEFAPALAELRSQILKGNITTDDAATAASKWGISLDATKKIISDTQAAFKSFVDSAVAGLPSSTDAVNQWSQDVQSAFTAFAQATAKTPGASTAGDAAIAAASARLTHAQTAAAGQQAQASAAAQAQLDAALARQAAAVSGTAAQQATAAAGVVKAQQAVSNAATKGSSTVVSAQAAVDAAYAKSGKAAGQNAADVLKAKQALDAALDPANVVKKVQEQAQQIVDFQTNILRLVKQFPAAARALLQDPDKQAAASFAAQLVNKPAIAAQFDQAERVLQNRTRDLKDISKGLADDFLSGGESAGAAATAGVAKTYKPVPVFNVQTQAALDSLAKQKEFAQAAGDLGAVATIGMQQKMILANVAQSSVAGAASAVTAGAAPIAKAAGDAGKLATGRYADGLDPKGKTEAALKESADAWNGSITATTASSARAGGRVVGFQFGKGIIDGMRLIDPQVQTAAHVLADNTIAATKGAMKQSSPSKVGIEIGANFGASIGLGISQTSSSAASSADRLVGQVVGAAGRAIAASSTGEVDIPVNITPTFSVDNAATTRVLAAARVALAPDVGRGIGDGFGSGIAAGIAAARVAETTANLAQRVKDAIARFAADKAADAQGDRSAGLRLADDLRAVQSAQQAFVAGALAPVNASVAAALARFKADVAANAVGDRTAGLRLAGDLLKLKAAYDAVAVAQDQLLHPAPTVDFTVPASSSLRIKSAAALADLRVVEAVLAKLRADEAKAATDPLAAKAIPQDLRNLQAAYASFNRTQIIPLSAAKQVAADTKAAQVALFTFAADFNRFKNDASKAPLLAAELLEVKKTSDALAAARARLSQPPVIPPIKVDVKFGRLPEVPPLELGVFLPRELPKPVVHVESDVSGVLRAAEELKRRFQAERLEAPFGIAPETLTRARAQISELADNLETIRARVPQLPAEEHVIVTADTTALLDAVRAASGLVSKPVVVPFHGDTTKLVADVHGALEKVTAARATIAGPAPAALSARLLAPVPQLVPAAPAPAPQIITKEAKIQVDFHRVDPPDPRDFAREIGWNL